MRHPIAALVALALPLVAIAQNKPKGTHNDQIYPPAPAAKSSVDFDGAGFIINGQRTVLASGTIHYPRVPHELWTDRMLRMKQANFNGIETYAFWNLNEPRENEWDFTGDKDIGAFLDTAKKMGLYATVRVGPYVCAEWDLGGWPVWLKFKPEMKVRTADPLYLALNDHWYDKIIPLVASHQINRGGNVILVQLENEHSLGWGVVKDDPYFDHLAASALSHGLEVPWFFSGLNHGGSPAPGAAIDPAKRANPWYSTEFWSGWFDAYRSLQPKKLRAIDRAQWTILAHGGGGYNFYMVHGGTNFETWNDDSVGASYDYGTAIGQTGDLRPMYYRMKRGNQLAHSFPEILAAGSDAGPDYKDFATGPGVQLLGPRRSPAGTLVFLQSTKGDDTPATFKNGDTFKLARYGTYPFPSNVAVDDGITIADATLPVLALARNGTTSTLVVYGQPGDTGHLNLALKSGARPGQFSSGISLASSTDGKTTLKITIPSSGIEEGTFDIGSRTLRILAINQDLSLYTWLVGATGHEYVVFGPSFVRDLNDKTPTVSLSVERPYGQALPGQIAVYGGRGQSWHLTGQANPTLDDAPAPALADWQKAVAPESAATLDVGSWRASAGNPEQMGADGDASAFAWYRTTVQLPSAGSGTLKLNGRDYLQVFVNGRSVTASAKGVATADFVAGANSIAVLVSHKGRNKVFAYSGSLVDHDNKGLFGDQILEIGGQKIPLVGWHMRGGVCASPDAIKGWTRLDTSASTEGLPAFYRARFDARPPAEFGAYPILRATFAGLSRGTLWVNGHNLGRYPEKIRIDSLYIPECWLRTDGQNELTILDEQGASPAGVRLVVEKESSRELVRVDSPVPASTPLVVPVENPPRNLEAVNKGNLAWHCAATSSVANNGGSPGNVTDGDPDTQWSGPDRTPDSWVQVDLGQPASVKVCEIYWQDPARNYKYTLEGSRDSQTWMKIGDQATAVPTSPDSPSELSRLNLPGAEYRYLRVTVGNPRGVGITELRAYNAAR